MDRSKSVGASEVAALFGLSPWQSEYSLWQQKAGLAEPQEETTRLAMGKLLERPILEYWAKREGYAFVHNTDSAPYPGLPVLTATPDAFVYAENGAVEEAEGAEVKTVRLGAREEWLNKVPPWYMMQVQAQMLVWGFYRTHLICCFGFDEISHTVIESDQQVQDEILFRVRNFWKRVTGELPPPEVDAHPATMAALMQAKRDAEKPAIAFDDTIAALDQELQVMTKRKTALEKDIRGAKAKILRAMGDATRGVLPDGTSWRVSLVNVKEQTKAAYSYQKLTRLKGDDAEEGDEL